MFTLIPGIAQPCRPSWWSRNVVSDAHQEPDREGNPTHMLRGLAACALLSIPVWVGIGLLLARLFG